jgi:hypothetical protein
LIEVVVLPTPPFWLAMARITSGGPPWSSDDGREWPESLGYRRLLL